MQSLKSLLLNKTNRPQVVTDCVQLIEQEVASKGGLSGMAIKAAYAVVKRFQPGIIQEAVDHLLDEFVDCLEPYFGQFAEQTDKNKKPIHIFFASRDIEIANALLRITDQRAERSPHKPLKTAYAKLRPTGVKHTVAAVPGIARIVASYIKKETV